MAIGMLVFRIFARPLMALFSATDEMYAIGIPALQIISLSFIFAGINVVLCSAFQALNHANTSLFITLARQLVFLLPLTYFLMHQFDINTGWYAFVLTEGVCAIFACIYYRKLKQSI